MRLATSLLRKRHRMSQDWVIPDYSIRVSKRARRVTIKVSSWAGLEVVIPVRFKRSEIPKILQSKADWIRKTCRKTETPRYGPSWYAGRNLVGRVFPFR